MFSSTNLDISSKIHKFKNMVLFFCEDSTLGDLVGKIGKSVGDMVPELITGLDKFFRTSRTYAMLPCNYNVC